MQADFHRAYADAQRGSGLIDTQLLDVSQLEDLAVNQRQSDDGLLQKKLAPELKQVAPKRRWAWS